MTDTIRVQGLGKIFRRYHSDRPVTLKQVFLRGFRQRKPVETFWPLRNVSFQIAAGRMVGVLGGNGAGKTTLLRLIGGVLRPDEGTVTVGGQARGLLELGSSFQPDLSGRENLFLSGLIDGFTRSEMEQRVKPILDFAEVEHAIDDPIRTFSTGMQMRLAFAITTQGPVDILLVDECLAVGDLAFQGKCLDRLAELKAEGTTILFVSHDATLMRQLCDELLWLRKGQLVGQGEPGVILDQYVAAMTEETHRRTPTEGWSYHSPTGPELRLNENRFGSLEIEIINVRLLNATGGPVSDFFCGDFLHVEIEYNSANPIDSPIFGVAISREDGFVCYDTSTAAGGLSFPRVCGKGRVSLYLERLDLVKGEYYVDVGVYEQDWAYSYDYHWHVYHLAVDSPSQKKGVLAPPQRWEIGG
jgi:homopolymeric O-antigen transport system ATP-binding protein